MTGLPSIVSPSTPALTSQALPTLVAQEGERAAMRFVEFFTAHLRNPNTRAAYGRAVGQFLAWCETQGLALPEILPVHVAAYIEALAQERAPGTVKQQLAAIRMLFDWLVVGQVVPHNPAAPVRGPKEVVSKGKTPVLDASEARQLLDSITTETVVGLRDRALIGLLVYSLARVGAAVAMRIEDFYPQGTAWWVRLHEKGGKLHDMPAHHLLARYLNAYIAAAGIKDDLKAPLFRSSRGRSGTITDRPLTSRNALDMIKRRIRDTGIETRGVCCHTFRATGITAYLANGGRLEVAQEMANHASARTTKLYDRTGDKRTQAEVEKIAI